MHVGRARGDERAEEEAPRAGVGCRLGVGDHEEREEQERAALEAMEGNRERFVERQGPPDDQKKGCRDVRERDVAARRALHDEAAGAGDEEAEERGASPLARGDPSLARHGDREDQSEIGGVEEVLAVEAEERLARDRRGRRPAGDDRRIRAQEQTQGERGDERTPRVVGRQPQSLRAEKLSGERRGHEQQRAGRRHVEAEEDGPVREEACQAGNLPQAGIGAAKRSERGHSSGWDTEDGPEFPGLRRR